VRGIPELQVEMVVRAADEGIDLIITVMWTRHDACGAPHPDARRRTEVRPCTHIGVLKMRFAPAPYVDPEVGIFAGHKRINPIRAIGEERNDTGPPEPEGAGICGRLTEFRPGPGGRLEVGGMTCVKAAIVADK